MLSAKPLRDTEEDHAYWLKQQLGLIEKLGPPNPSARDVAASERDGLATRRPPVQRGQVSVHRTRSASTPRCASPRRRRVSSAAGPAR